MPADVLDVLLIEDNPGDARLIEEMLGDAGKLLERVDVGASTWSDLRFHQEDRLASGLDHLSGNDVDVVLLDLGLPDSDGLDTLTRVVDATDFVPIVVLTVVREEGTGIEAIHRGAQDYLVKGEMTGNTLVRSFHYAIERNRQERERHRRREQLEALNSLNRIAQDVTRAVITTSSREDLERAVCEHLVESDAYRFAWIGAVDRASDRLTPRVAAGVDESTVDELTAAVDGGDTAQGPFGEAVRTHEVQVVGTGQSDGGFEHWRRAASDDDVSASALVPVVYRGLLYGVLTIDATTGNAFSGPEVAILSRLGDVIGHAITAIERKDALVSDTVVELEFRVEGLAEELVDRTADGEARIEFEHLVDNGDLLTAFGLADGIPRAEFLELAERTDVIEDVRVSTSARDGFEFEVVTDAVGSLVRAVAAHGGDVPSATIADGEFRIVVTFPPGRDKRQLVRIVEGHCSGAVNVAQRTSLRSESSVATSRGGSLDDLTDKQRSALETAYYAGYFDWPRTSTGEEIADRMGISPSTFTQHLRGAERKYFDATFDDERTTDGPTSSAWSSAPDRDDDGPA